MSNTATLEIDLTGTTRLDFLINQNHSFELELDHFQDDGVTPLPLTGTWSGAISKTETAEGKVMDLVQGAAIVVVDNKLTIKRSVIQNTLQPGIYYYDIRNDNVDLTSVKGYKGRIIVQSSIS